MGCNAVLPLHCRARLLHHAYAAEGAGLILTEAGRQIVTGLAGLQPRISSLVLFWRLQLAGAGQR